MITAIRITAEGQRAVDYLTQLEAPNQKRRTENRKAEALSERKQVILAATHSGQWVTMRVLLKRLRSVEVFEDLRRQLTPESSERDYTKLTNELINMSTDGLIKLGRNEPTQCHDCGSTPPRLYVTSTLANDSYDGSDNPIVGQTPPLCQECYAKRHVNNI